VSPVAIRAAKSAQTGSCESSSVCRLNFLPECFFSAAFMATLTFPDVLTTGARDRLRGKFLFQRLPTNWTIFAPHIHTCLSLTKGPVSNMSLGGRCSPVCPNRDKARLFLFAQLLHARRASLLRGYWFACVPASAALESRTEVPAKIAKWICSWACVEFQDHFSLEVGEREG